MRSPIGRFQVMAVLQAARAKALGYGEEEAQSFGLNRAIFYAAAKHGFKGASSKHVGDSATYHATEGKTVQRALDTETVGDELAYCVHVQGKRVFVMGDDLLTSEQFARQIADRFGTTFPSAWSEAQAIVAQCPQDVLVAKKQFYAEVYKPQRDDLATKWSTRAKEEQPR